MSGTRTYQAYTMAEALAAVKYDLGPEAVILSTRTFKRGGLLGMGRRTVVEVTAANTRAATAPPPAPTPAAPGKPVDRAYAASKPAAPANKQAIAARGAAVQALASEADRQRQRRLAMAVQEKQRRAAEGNPPDAARPTQPRMPAAPVATPLAAATGAVAPAIATIAPPPSRMPQPQAAAGNGNSLLVSVPATPMSVAAKRFILRSADAPARPAMDISSLAAADESMFAPASIAAPMQPTPAGIVSIGAPPQQAVGYAAPNRAAASGRNHHANVEMDPKVQNELAAIKSMVGQVLQRQTVASRQHTPSMPPRLFDVYLRLVGLDVPDDLADAIVTEMRERLSPAEVENDAALHAAAIDNLADYIAVAPTPLNHTAPNNRPLTIALVGPTGVGKTTTLAKLAASFKLKAGRKVGLITSDTYRIAAVDQLRTYANIIGLPLQVALTPADMRQAVAAMNDCEVVLVDTAGRSQKDAMRIAELRQFIEAAHPHEVHMVLSATASEKVLTSEAEAFGRVGVNKLILTKMDEAASLGGLMSLLRLVNKPVSFITTGQEVPDHLEPASSRRLAELMLGGAVSPTANMPEARYA